MEFSIGAKGRNDEIIDLFAAVFTASEGPEEGALIADLVRNLLDNTPERDLLVVRAEDAGTIVGAIIFSRLLYDQDDRIVFILSPVAVATGLHGRGIGKSLIAHGLQQLKTSDVDLVVTYGDPRYYSKVGFSQISQAFAAAPFELKHPEGWLAQSLTDARLTPLKGCSRCVAALNDPVLW